MNEATALDVIVIGAGPAGLSASYYLNQRGLSHLVFERGRIGQSWRAQRWDSFTVNTANRLNALPGSPYAGPLPDGFDSAANFVATLEAYVVAHRLPVVEESEILAVDQLAGSPFFRVTVSRHRQVKTYACRQVIVASGQQSERRLPAFADRISPTIHQLHTADYRSPDHLPPGAVLVAGSGQSGCQIAEELLDTGRRVYLSTSLVPRVPRRYRGKDIMDWLLEIGFMKTRTEAVTDPAERAMRTPVLSGVGPHGHTLSLQGLARKGATLLGKMERAEGSQVFFQPNAARHVQAADGFSNQVKERLDAFIAENGITAPPPEVDEADLPDLEARSATDLPALDLHERGITSLVWSTGFGSQFGYLNLPVLDGEGNPKHRNGSSDVAGLYFLGLHWLRNRKSGLLCGIGEDAEWVTDQSYAHSLQTQPT